MSERAESFDAVAEDYLRARARYPSKMIDYIVETAGLTPTSRILDVGCGSGQATMEFATRGYEVVAVDPAQRALDLLAAQCSDGPNVELVHSTLEELDTEPAFDLIICAQAFHWLDPDTAPGKFRELLKPNGHVMIFWHMQDVSPGSVQADLYSLCSRYFDSYPIMNPPEYAPEFLDAMSTTLCRHGHFEGAHTLEYPWKQTYEPAMFRSLFRSSSMYSMLSEAAKVQVDDDLKGYLDSLPGDPLIHYRTCLIRARRARQIS